MDCFKNNHIKFVSFILLELFILLQTDAQVLIFERDKTLGGNKTDKMVFVSEISDYNIIMGGNTQTSLNGDVTEANNGGWDYWVMLLDSSTLTPLWNKTFGGSKDEQLAYIQLLSDGSYVLAGSSNSPNSGDKSQNSKGGWDFWVVKINSSGTKLWDKTFGGSGDDMLTCMDISLDGGYLLGGYSNSDKTGDKSEDSRGGNDFWILKIDASGNVKWDKTFGGSSEDSLAAIVTDPPNDYYFIAGNSLSPADNDKSSSNAGGMDYWALQLDKNGNKIWDNTYGGSQTDRLAGAELGLTQNGYFLAGYSNSGISGEKSQNSKGGYDYWMVSTDSIGNVVWDKTIGGPSDDYLTCTLYSIEGRHVVGGFSNSDALDDKTSASLGGYDYWIVKIDSTSNKVYDYAYGGTDNDFMYYFSQSCNRGFYLGGESYSGIGENKSEANKGISDYWLVKVNSPTLPLFSFEVACEGAVTLFYDRTEVFPDFWYWDFDDPTSGADNSSYDKFPSHIYNQPGTYNVTLVVKEGCQPDTTVTVQVEIPENRLKEEVELGEDTVLCEGQVMQLSVPYDSAFSYTWSTGETTTSITIDEPGTYSIVATDGLCTSYDAVVVGSCPRLFTPNIFSPDGDGNNDVFYVYGIGVTEIELLIFDRWGQKVFETTDMNEGWDGTLNGKQLPIDTYVYKVSYKGIGNYSFKKIGNISLVR